LRLALLGLLLAAGASGARLELVHVTGAHEVRSPPTRRLARRSYARSLATLLRDRGFLEAAAPLLAAIPEPVVELRVQAWDGGRLSRGEELRVPEVQPDGTARRVMVKARRGETIATFSRRLGLPEAGLRMVNDTRFDVMPFSLRVADVPTVYMGEAGLQRLAASHELDRREQLIAWTVLHELAHLAAPMDCTEEIADRYGDDWEHWSHERILPGAALSEGWADYQAARQLPWYRRRVMATEVRVRVEERVTSGRAWSVRYLWLSPEETRAEDRLATREGVTRLLLELDEAPLAAAERDTRGRECRDLPRLLARIASPWPSLRQACAPRGLRPAWPASYSGSPSSLR
jgi:hypothetical protein